MMWGGGLSYGYDTFLGPIEITFNYSNVTHKWVRTLAWGMSSNENNHLTLCIQTLSRTI